MVRLPRGEVDLDASLPTYFKTDERSLLAENPARVVERLVDHSLERLKKIIEGRSGYLSSADAALLLDEIQRLNKLTIALHTSIAQLYAFCTPAEGMHTPGEAAMEKAWDILCFDDPTLERARELEKAEKMAVVYETALERISSNEAFGTAGILSHSWEANEARQRMRLAKEALERGQKIHDE